MHVELSDAIMLGALMKPQALDAGRWPEKSCALQAACDAVGINSCDHLVYNQMSQQWPWAASQRVVCPECSYKSSVLLVIAFCLNDTHHWSREKISAWVREIEPKATLPAEPVTLQAVAK